MSDSILEGEFKEEINASEEMKELLKILNDESTEVDQIHFSRIEDDICVVPYRSSPIKGYGSYYLTDEEFALLKGLFPSFEFIGINPPEDCEESEDPKPLKIAQQISLKVAESALKV